MTCFSALDLWSVEEDDALFQEISLIFIVGMQHFQTAAVILAYDLDIFRNLCKSESSNVEELARVSGAEPALLGEFRPTTTALPLFSHLHCGVC